ncbi:MAG: hypothetical protein PVJ77_27875 [Desulfobacterales bacterium]
MTEFITILILLIILVVAFFWLLDFFRSRKEPWNERNGTTYPRYALVIIVALIGIGLLLKAQPEPIVKQTSPTYKLNFNLQRDLERSVDSNSYKFLSVKSKSFPLNAACDYIDDDDEKAEQCEEIKCDLKKQCLKLLKDNKLSRFGPESWVFLIGGHDRLPVRGGPYGTNTNLSFRRAAFVADFLTNYKNSDCPLDESFGLKAETEESFGLKADQVIFMPGGVRDPGDIKHFPDWMQNVECVITVQSGQNRSETSQREAFRMSLIEKAESIRKNLLLDVNGLLLSSSELKLSEDKNIHSIEKIKEDSL